MIAEMPSRMFSREVTSVPEALIASSGIPVRFKSGRALLAVLAVSMLLSTPAAALAQDEEGPRPVLDARLEGLANNKGEVQGVSEKVSGGYTLTWVVFFILAGIAVGPLFKDARRSHLD